jgi:hypothetical protein
MEADEAIHEKYRQVDKFIADKELSNKRSIMMKHELHNLKVVDT